jgi:hypothetical protein
MNVGIDYDAAKKAYELSDRIKRNNFEYGSVHQGVNDHYKTTAQK